MPAYLKLLSYSSRVPGRVCIKSLRSYEHNYTAQTSTMVRAEGRILALTWIQWSLDKQPWRHKEEFWNPITTLIRVVHNSRVRTYLAATYILLRRSLNQMLLPL